MCAFVTKNTFKMAANTLLSMTACSVFVVVTIKMSSGSHQATIMVVECYLLYITMILLEYLIVFILMA
jgi:hypothetical protein